MELSEAIEKNRVDRVELLKGPRQRQLGSLVLTGHHLIFAPADNNEKSNEFWLLHRAVDRVTTEPGTPSTDSPTILHLKCKNFLICSFSIPNQSDCNAVARSIERLSNLSNLEFEYPFYHPKTFETLDDGWTAFDIQQQFVSLMLVCDRWRISAVNKNFEVCPTYPEHVIVPQGIGDDFLRISSTYRDGSRFPVLAYFHPNSKSCIVRCGQPLVSPTNRRCKEDELILNSLLTPHAKGVIYDTRSESIAISARGRGGGKEQRYHYSQWHYVHGNLPRIREFKESLTRLIEACVEYKNSDKWLSKLTSSMWLQYVCDSLTGAGTIAQWIHCGGENEKPVVVHGGEGMDTTLLVTALAQILLDSDPRTVRGFQALIEREFIMAGHPFHTRCSHAAFAQGTLTGPFEAPIFVCFLDCVWQLVRQYPTCFEFNQEFLIFVAEHTYASEFGSFLGNNEKEKKEHQVKERTASLWSYVNHPKILAAYINPIYKPYDAVLWPSVAAQSIVLWERFYLRWQRNWEKSDKMYDRLAGFKARENELRAKLLSRSTLQQSISHQKQKNGSLKHSPVIQPADVSPVLLTGLEEKVAAI